MPDKIIHLNSISEIHDYYTYPKPKHPLVTVIDLARAKRNRPEGVVHYSTAFYNVGCKRFEGTLKYGKSYYDFNEGTLMFTAPNQVISSSPDMQVNEGWALFFHPDLIHATELGRKIHQYSFFSYDVSEALHISEDEKLMLQDCLKRIEKEYSQNVDKHTGNLIVDNIQLLLNYCSRFYDRQFITRAKVNNDLVQKFDMLLLEYFAQESLVNTGLPDVKYFASRLNLSPSYLSDLLSKYTGKTTQEHIHLQLIDKAKSLLLGSDQPIRGIAYDLGFEHPSHFTKLFKSKTGMSPKEFRGVN